MRFHRALLYYGYYFGINTSFKLVLIPRLKKFLGKKNDYTERLLNWFEGLFLENIKKQKNKKIKIVDDESIAISHIIWTLWWQGKEGMPDVIKKCHKSLCDNANGWEVRLMDKDNYRNYIELPKHIEDKFLQNKISYTHLSDVIRLLVITKYGGLWVDAAIFVTHPICISGSFFSLNLSKISPEYCFRRWVVGVLGCRKNYEPLCFVKEVIIDYWKRYDAAIDYLMFDYIMLLTYNKLPQFKADVDTLSPCMGNIHESRYLFNDKVDYQRFNEIVNDNIFLSLTWRFPYNEKTEDGKMTYWGMLLKEFNK